MTLHLKSHAEQIVDEYRGYTVTRDGDLLLAYNEAGHFRAMAPAGAEVDIYAEIDREIAKVRDVQPRQPALFPGIYLDAINRQGETV